MRVDLGDNVDWYHTIKLPDGTVIPGLIPGDAWEKQGLPERLDGQVVLDIGCRDGYYSFEAERRGALSVHAIDIRLWPQYTFLQAKMRTRVRFEERDIHDFHGYESYDFVIFSQVLYHLHSPWLGLMRVAEAVCKTGRVFFETACSPESGEYMLFQPYYSTDASTTWIPTIGCLNGMLREVGLHPEAPLQVVGGRTVGFLRK